MTRASKFIIAASAEDIVPPGGRRPRDEVAREGCRGARREIALRQGGALRHACAFG